MWYGVGALVLFLSVIPLAGLLDRSHGQRRESISIIFGIVLAAMVALIIACSASQ